MTRRGKLLAALCGLFLGLGIFTFDYGEGLSYFSADPEACVNCHIMRPQHDSWLKSSHHTVANCIDCHLPHKFVPKWLTKAENGFQHSKKFTLQNFHEPIFIREYNRKIVNNNCLHCHADFMHEILRGETKNNNAMSCVACHRQVGH